MMALGVLFELLSLAVAASLVLLVALGLSFHKDQRHTAKRVALAALGGVGGLLVSQLVSTLTMLGIAFVADRIAEHVGWHWAEDVVGIFALVVIAVVTVSGAVLGAGYGWRAGGLRLAANATGHSEV
jgi:hypothetical protein